MDLTRETILSALKRLGELGAQEGVVVEISLYGGVAMMLAYSQREVTKDVDALIKPADVAARLAKQVGEEFGLHDHWLNDDVKQFLSPLKEDKRTLEVEELEQLSHLRITVPTAKYLLALKAMACREPLPGQEGDYEDLKFLIHKINIRSVEEIQDAIDAYFPDDVIPKDKQIFLQDIIEEVHAQ